MSVLISNVYLAWKQSLRGDAASERHHSIDVGRLSVTFMYSEAATGCISVRANGS